MKRPTASAKTDLHSKRDPAALLLAEYRSFVGETLVIIDQLEHAILTGSEEQRSRLVPLRDQLLRNLVRHGARPTATRGGQLDLRYHEVVGDPPVQGSVYAIAEVIRSGWEMSIAGVGDFTLRQAQVVVSADGNNAAGVNDDE